MNLETLLDHTAHHVLDDRADLLSGAPDELWSDEVIVRYLNDGQNIFCRKAWPIIDATTAAVCELTPVADQKNYALHASIVRVLTATPLDTDIPLVWLNNDLIAPSPQHTLPDYYQTPPLATLEAAGRPGWYSTDYETRVLRLRPAPSADEVTRMGKIMLRVARMPVTPLTVENPQGVPEIPEEYHLDLCDYAAGRILMHPNVDKGEAKSEGTRLVESFYAKLRMAKNDRLISQNAPGRYVFGGWARTWSY